MKRSRRFQWRSRRERGASAVEFALVLPILLLVVFAIVTYGFIFGQDLALGNAARQTARYGVVQGHSCDAIKAAAVDSAKPLVSLAVTDVTVTRGKTSALATSPCTTGTTEPCEDSATDDNLYIKITYKATVLIPVVPGMGKTMDISSLGVFRCEFA